MKRIAILLSAIAGMYAYGQAFTNGSFNGTGSFCTYNNNIIPTGWTVLSGSPDSYQPFPTCPWASGVTASPNGGSYAAFINNSVEGIYQTVTGLVVGQVYCVSFWYSTPDYFGFGSGQAAMFSTKVDLPAVGTYTNIGNTPLKPFGSGWLFYSVTFTATRTSHRIAFVTNATIGATVSYAIDGATLSFGLSCSPLPADASPLQLHCSGTNHLTAQFTTSNESNTKYFILQNSADAFAWENVDTFPAAGNSNILLYYSKEISLQNDTGHYFRLVSEDLDSRTRQYDPVYIQEFCTPNEIYIYPNPAQQTLYISCNNIQQAKVYTCAGQEITIPVLKVSADLLQLDVQYLSSGVYILQFNDTHGQLYNRSFIKNE